MQTTDKMELVLVTTEASPDQQELLATADSNEARRKWVGSQTIVSKRVTGVDNRATLLEFS